MKIIKRNGSEETFNINKIIHAIEKANITVAAADRLTAKQIFGIASEVENECSSMPRACSVEEIQEKVETKIMEQGTHEVAKNYIRYRYTRTLVRQSNTTDNHILTLIECNNEEAKQSHTCYAYMFANCTKLETAPELPAEATTWDCYLGMFSDCTNLTKAPLIAATNIEGWYACKHMFENCSNLTYVKMRATSIGSQSVEGFLLNAGNNASVIYVPKGMASNEVLKAAVPSNWTIVEED